MNSGFDLGSLSHHFLFFYFEVGWCNPNLYHLLPRLWDDGISKLL